jgi:soluble lytic murein transglycosylase-like protein
MFGSETKEGKKDGSRKEKDFVTEIMYLPRKRSRVLTIAIIAFFYFILSPRFFSNINVEKRMDAGFFAYRTIITEVASECGVSPALIAAMIKTESNFRPHVTSSMGATGLMQLLPSTAKQFNITNLRDPEQNIRAGALYIKSLISQFRGNLTLAVAAYNAGPGNVKKHGGVPPFAETQRYVVKVKRSIKEFQGYF